MADPAAAARGALPAQEARVLAKRASKRRRRPRAALPVYVSGDHNEALESLHAAIRVGEVAFAGLAMLHVDSHPDLMVPPRMPADIVFRPRDLHWELAKSETGIAEFILPAVYAGHLDRLVWLRPAWADQLPDGTWTFAVGKAPKVDADEIVTEEGETVAGGPLRVTWRAPYYEDEGLTCAAEDLEQAKTVQLLVAASAACTQEAIDKVCGERPWILDICLDYFSVNNPFFVDLDDKLGAAAAEICREVFAGDALAWRRAERARMDRAAVAADETVADALKARYDTAKREHEAAIAALLAANTSTSGAEVKAPDAEAAMARLRACFEVDVSSQADAVAKTVAAFSSLLQSVSASHRELIASCGPNLDLPHHRSSDAELESLFAHLRELLVSLAASGKEPSIVTIAKSSSDLLDYTPVDQVQQLLERTLRLLKEVYPSRDLEVSYVDEDEDNEDPNANKEDAVKEM